MHTARMADVTQAIASEYGWWMDDLNLVEEIDALDDLDEEEGL
jgi:hypothetical protein